jgi:hypothetical protein
VVALALQEVDGGIQQTIPAWCHRELSRPIFIGAVNDHRDPDVEKSLPAPTRVQDTSP